MYSGPSGGPLEDPSLIGNREDIPKGKDPTPEVPAYNDSFSTSFRGELLSVGGPVVSKDGSGHSFSVLWRSSKFLTEHVSETGGDALKEMPRLTDKAIVAPEKQTSSSHRKSLGIAELIGQEPAKLFNSDCLFSILYPSSLFFCLCYSVCNSILLFFLAFEESLRNSRLQNFISSTQFLA
jgi:hypothetical protein